MNQDRLQQLETNLRSKRIDLRKAALDELTTIDSDLAIPILKKVATEKDFGLRCIAMMGFRNHLTDESFDFLKNVLETDKDGSVLAEAANSIFDFGEKAIAILLDLFDRSDSWIVRHTVVALLVETDEPDVMLTIAKKAVRDENQMTQEIVIVALSKLLNTDLKPEAFDLFGTLAVDKDWYIRWRTAIALTAFQEPRAKELLAQLQKDENYRVVAAALEKGEEGI